MTASLIAITADTCFVDSDFMHLTNRSQECQTIAYRDLDTFSQMLAVPGVIYWDSRVGMARRVWNEARIENDHRTALEMLGHTGMPVPSELDTLRELNRVQQNRINALLRESNRPVLEGSDERMTEFWRKAAVAANEAGFCPEYDKLARAMGGVARDDMDTSYVITMNLSTTVSYRVTVPLGSDVENDVWSYVDTSELEAEIDTSRYDWSVESVEEDND